MKQLLAGLMVLAGLVTVFARSVDLRAPLVVYYADEKFKLEVTPPSFRAVASYEAFQADAFLVLTQLEGEENACKAVVVGRLYQKRKDGYALVWSRPLPGKIPSNAFLFTVDDDDVLAVVEGVRAPDTMKGRPFSVYNLNGSSVTNGVYATALGMKWRSVERAIELVTESGEIKARVTPNDK